MARRKKSKLGSFFEGFNDGYDTTGKVLTDYELAKVMREEPVGQDYRQEVPQGADVDPREVDGAASAPTRYSYGGKDFTEKPTDQQMLGLRMGRMADVYAKHGDPTKAMQLRAQGLQYDAAQDQLARGRKADEKLAGERKADDEIANWQQFAAARSAADPRVLAGLRENPETAAAYAQYYAPGSEVAPIRAAATRGYNAAKGLALGNAQQELSEEGEFKKMATALTGGKKGIFNWYEKDMPDGWNVRERKNPDGTFTAVQYKNEGGKEVLGKDIVSYKNDLDLQMQMAANSPKLLPKVLELKQKAAHDEATAAIWDKRMAQQNRALEARTNAGGIKDPKAYEAGVKNHNDLMEQYEETPTPELEKAIRLNQISLSNAAGRPYVGAEPKRAPEYAVKTLGDTTYKLDTKGNPVATFNSALSQWLPPGMSEAVFTANKAAARKSGLDFVVGENEQGTPEVAFIAGDGSQHATLPDALGHDKMRKKSEGLRNRSPEDARLGNYAASRKTTSLPPVVGPSSRSPGTWRGPLSG